MTRRLAATVATAFALLVPANASADLVSSTFNPITDWSTVLPSLSPQYNPNDPNICNSGKPQCVDAVEREMTKRFKPLADSCSHNVLFSLLYLRVTNHVGDSVWTPGRFQDPPFMTHYAAVFADYYFKGYDAWTNGTAPTAWKIALDAAKNHEVQGIGNLLLGMNAHINRDLPFVLYAIGLRAPDGTSRKPDHDEINRVLYEAYGPAISEGARRFDDGLNQYTGENASDSGIQSVIAWREQAWRNAERLASASSALERAVITQEIEQAANTEAQAIKQAYAYRNGETSAPRDAYCAAHSDG